MPADRIEPYPERSAKDVARAGMDAGLAAIPLVGGSVEILVDAVLAPAFDRRKDQWFRELGEVVNALADRFDSLASDEVFISAVAETSRIAVGTHREDKLRILRDCLINVASIEGRDDFMTLQLVRLLDTIEPEHVVVLKYFHNPRGWYEEHGLEQPNLITGPRRAIMDRAGLPISGAPLELVIRNLGDLGLADTSLLSGMVSENSLWQELTTPLGSAFLDLVLGQSTEFLA